MKIKFQFNVSLQKDAEEKKNTVTVNNSSFVDCARKEILNARERGSFSTAANYDTALRSLLTFIKREDIMLNEITTEMLESYQKWLLRRNVSLNTVSCYMRSLRSIYNRATDSKSRVFSRIFTGCTPTYKRSLCVDDIQRLSALKLSKGSRLALARDIFLFSFYCQGMPFIDLAFLRKEQVAGGSIVYNRHKTGQMVRIAVEPCMEQIIQKYSSTNSVYVFPLLESTDMTEAYNEYQKQLSYYNLALKRLGKRAGVSRPLTSYVARHSWASIAFQTNVELQTISRAMGHTNPMTTSIYIKELDNSHLATANHKIITVCSTNTDDDSKGMP